MPNNVIFCATGICNNAGTGSFTPCNLANGCAVPGESCSLPPGAVNFCSAGYKVRQPCPGGDTDCRPVDQRARCVGKCTQPSAIAGKDCRNTAECRVPSQCASFSYWTPPQNQCKNNFRPTAFTMNFDGKCNGTGPACNVTDPTSCGNNLNACIPDDANSPGDWCGIPPQVYNITIENATGNTFDIFGGSGNVTLKFNVKIDEEQLPMKLLMVDWGDGTPVTQTSSKFGLRDKPDLRDPFIFPHVYQYNAANGDPNKYVITIKVKDNWDWCTCPLASMNCLPNLCDASPNTNARITVPTEIDVYAP